MTHTEAEVESLGTVIVCAGPPDCMLEGDEAVAEQIAGCTLCKRIMVMPDGNDIEYKAKAS